MLMFMVLAIGKLVKVLLVEMFPFLIFLIFLNHQMLTSGRGESHKTHCNYWVCWVSGQGIPSTEATAFH